MSDIVFVVANKKSYKDDATKVQYFPDCTLSISHSFDNDVTEHAVEDGTAFSDHIQNKNNTFTVSGIYNTRSLNVYAPDNIGQTNRVQEAYAFLKSLRDDRLTFTLVSKYSSYPDCVVKSLRIPVAPTDGNTMIFEMDITQIRKAKLELVNLVATQTVAENKKDDAALNSSAGRTQAEVRRSLIKEITADTNQATDILKQTQGLAKGTGG